MRFVGIPKMLSMHVLLDNNLFVRFWTFVGVHTVGVGRRTNQHLGKTRYVGHGQI